MDFFSLVIAFEILSPEVLLEMLLEKNKNSPDLTSSPGIAVHLEGLCSPWVLSAPLLLLSLGDWMNKVVRRPSAYVTLLLRID